MLIFEELQVRGHESLSLIQHPMTGLRAVLAVHSTALGPAIAGVRLRRMDEEALVRSALDLSESLTYKSALAGLNFGGGACVIMPGDENLLGSRAQPHTREALFRALGRELRPLSSRVILTEDIGVTPRDISFVAQETPGTLGQHTDTSRVTGYGVYRGMKAAAKYVLDSESMRGVRVAIYGLGGVGRELAEHLAREGARLIVADSRPHVMQELVEDLGAEAMEPADILDAPCDVFAPCASGSSIPAAAVSRLQCRMIAGSEHHPLTRAGEDAVREAGIVYIPDFAINSAGLIAAAQGVSKEEAAEQVYQNVARICEVAQHVAQPVHLVARMMAEQRISLIGSLGRGE
ncbi:Glu/Leu/Phe/Val dehydrogenase family protein [Deinococcus radiophilus]|uniref:Glu/Leu/Phe/Val dehydrogenase n=1 Tax=Deinococcus radiophilus TaxID=32062 RepID=A0A3S0RAI2_9DEIO|nr:Glu/Leu/Phe/Val dehydrogenase dimerization domain-containing protein [Deinococcus radiophilus]RTR22362.1 Glu/Leu/Phe/Val dehydrogenase [Deinococcus radiophilus]UFA50001.1 Glu/Leu/Phe/Val dehydrogenase [Deinococcus radiophilus]